MASERSNSGFLGLPPFWLSASIQNFQDEYELTLLEQAETRDIREGQIERLSFWDRMRLNWELLKLIPQVEFERLKKKFKDSKQKK